MKTKITRLLLSAVLMMCCTLSTWGETVFYYTTNNGSRISINQGDAYDKTKGEYVTNHTYDPETNSGSITISGMGGASSIPEKFFWDKDNLETIVIPNSIRTIDYYAFRDCDGLISIKIPNAVTEISNGAFYHCDNLKTVEFEDNRTHDLELGSIVYNPQIAESDYYGIFEECDELESIIIPSTVYQIGERAFYDCDKLSSVVFEERQLIQNNVTFILEWAFYNCDNLQRVTIGDGEYTFYEGAFENCDGLHSVFLHSDPSKLHLKKDCFKTGEGHNFYVRNQEMMDKYSQAYDFKGNLKLYPEEFTIKYKTTDGKATGNCSGNTFNTYESGIGIMYFDHIPTSIDGFGGCTTLESVLLPHFNSGVGFYIINSNAFAGCSSLKEVFCLSENTVLIGENAFAGSPGIAYAKESNNTGVRSWRSGKGSGTFASPLEIENYINLYGLSLEVKYQNGAGLCAKLTNDIVRFENLLDENGNLQREIDKFDQWLPIGTYENPFIGTFDGNGHTISGLYINDASMDCAALFGRTTVSQSILSQAYIHDLGLKDSYFSGNNWVAGICGDFAGGRIVNCWNGATVIGNNSSGCAGGIAASCWTDASVASCYNIGKVSVVSSDKSQCGGICGTVIKNPNVTYSVSDCVSLEGKCDVAFNHYSNVLVSDKANIKNVSIMDDNAFARGEVCWLLNGCPYSEPQYKENISWRQELGSDKYPNLTSIWFVYNGSSGSEKHFTGGTLCSVEQVVHVASMLTFHQKTGSCEKGYIAQYSECDYCHEKFYYDGYKYCKVESLEIPPGHDLEHFPGVAATCTSDGNIDYWHCNTCGKNFTTEDCSEQITTNVAIKGGHKMTRHDAVIPIVGSDGNWLHWTCSTCGNSYFDAAGNEKIDPDNITVSIQDNEIWYIPVAEESITLPTTSDDFKKCVMSNTYLHGLGKITLKSGTTAIGRYGIKGEQIVSVSLPSSITEIAEFAFSSSNEKNAKLEKVYLPPYLNSIGERAFGCSHISRITIPASVTSINNEAFFSCLYLSELRLKSLPSISSNTFYGCSYLSTKILDLTDSEKPYIGTSTANYPGFTEARYHRTLEQGKWGTIVLPFAPTGGMKGLEFYELKSITTQEEGSLVFTKVETVKAGVPYLFRNTSSTSDFTLTASTPTVTVNTTGQTAGDFTLKGSFQQKQLNGAENGNLYYLSGNEFYHANGKINIAPFRAYIEGNGATSAKSFVLVVSDNGEDITAIPGIMDENGTIDETEAIYDLNGRRLTTPVKGQVNVIRTKSGKTIKVNFANRAQ